jgi:antitoxin ParD1/3/4
MPTRNVNLTDHFDQFIAGEIEAGRYSNASEVMRAGLRLLEQQKQEDAQRLERLRLLVQEGIADIERGHRSRLHNEEEIRDYVAEIGREVRQRQGQGDVVRTSE